MTSNDLNIIPTRALLHVSNTTASNFQAIVYVSHEKHQKSKEREDNTGNPVKHYQKHKSEGAKDNVVNLKKYRQEIHSFGISGFRGDDKNMRKIHRLIELGAKPSKRENKNYKELLAERKRAKIQSEQEKALWMVGKNALGLPASKTVNKKFTRRTPIDKISEHYGVVKPSFKRNKK